MRETDRAVPDGARSTRADARRNRAKVLEAAAAALAEGGLSVPVQEIARRAGVGTGTVSRHFPTKRELFEAIVLDRVGILIDRAGELSAELEPGPAFFAFFAWWVRADVQNRALAEVLAGSGFDLEGAALRAGLDFGGTLAGMLGAAQRAGAVRPDAEPGDVKALLIACLSRPDADEETRERMIRLAGDALRPPAGATPAEG